MIDDFPASLTFTLKQEGGNDDDPQDHGGRTSRGITQREWDAWRRVHISLPADVWRAPQVQIDAIYHTQYWLPNCDRMPVGVDLSFFDFGVLTGPYRATILLQRAIGVGDDGHLGLVSWAAIEASNPLHVINVYASQQRTFHRASSQFRRYGKGWLARVDAREKAALKLGTR